MYLTGTGDRTKITNTTRRHEPTPPFPSSPKSGGGAPFSPGRAESWTELATSVSCGRGCRKWENTERPARRPLRRSARRSAGHPIRATGPGDHRATPAAAPAPAQETAPARVRPAAFLPLGGGGGQRRRLSDAPGRRSGARRDTNGIGQLRSRASISDVGSAVVSVTQMGQQGSQNEASIDGEMKLPVTDGHIKCVQSCFSQYGNLYKSKPKEYIQSNVFHTSA